MPDASALTCEFCRNNPAARLMVYDVGTKDCRAPMRIKKLACETCATADTSRVAVTPPSAWVFTLTPVLELANA